MTKSQDKNVNILRTKKAFNTLFSDSKLCELSL